MEIRTFRARTMREALAQVRRELGPGAAVLHTRPIRRGPLATLLTVSKGLTAGTGVEVAATREPPPALLARSAPEPIPQQEPLESPPSLTNRVSARLDELQTMVASLTPASVPDREIQQLREQLAEADVDPKLCDSLCDQAASDFARIDTVDTDLLREHAVQTIAQRLSIGGPIAPGEKDSDQPVPHIVCLAGSTGVGKTTTVAKLAATLSVTYGHRVGLITLDCYRVAAVDQLRTYAELLDLPMEIANGPEQLARAIEHLAACDLILIDTEGRSPRDAAGIEKLRASLDAVAIAEVHLAVSASSSPRGVRETLRAFEPIGPTSLLLTKLDETPSLGHLLHVIHQAALPIGYTTDGQGVPEDLALADAERLARSVLAA